jgi:hypothetical protein
MPYGMSTSNQILELFEHINICCWFVNFGTGNIIFVVAWNKNMDILSIVKHIT